jgi:hypothetical protein
MMGACLFLGGSDVCASDSSAQLFASANKSINDASSAVENARISIEEGKKLLEKIPADSDLSAEVTEVISAISKHWDVTVKALATAEKTAPRILKATKPGLAEDYKLLATISAGVALSGAQVVQTGILFVDAVANNKTEALSIIRKALADALSQSDQVDQNYDRAKKLIMQKYSK